MSIEIQWEEPPARRGATAESKYAEVMAALKANPGRSAVVYHGKTSCTTWWKSMGFESTSRQQEDGTVKTYACWPTGKDPNDTTPVAPSRRGRKRKTPAQDRPAAAEPDQDGEEPTPTVARPTPNPEKPVTKRAAAGTHGQPLVSQRPRAPRPSTAAKTPPTGALATGGETTGTCTRCKTRRQIGVQDHLCRKCRLDDAIRSTR